VNRDSELDAFKRKVDLRQFAVSLGYEMDRARAAGSTVLRRDADKIVVKRNHNGHYVFFSVRDDRTTAPLSISSSDRQNLDLGAVRQILRPWMAALPPTAVSPVEPTSRNRMRVELRTAAC